MKNFDYYVALITATATEEAGVMHMYKDWKPLNLEGDSQKYYETAVEQAILPKPKGLIIKSVCNYADEEKSDQYQRFAAFTSSQFAKYLIENYLPC